MGDYYANLPFVDSNLFFSNNSNPWLFLESTVAGLAVTISRVPHPPVPFFATEVAVCFCPLQRECFC